MFCWNDDVTQPDRKTGRVEDYRCWSGRNQPPAALLTNTYDTAIFLEPVFALQAGIRTITPMKQTNDRSKELSTG